MLGLLVLGELQCGTTWESALIAAQHKLDNLVVIVDNNGFQAMGKNEEILRTDFPAMGGWSVYNVDGHDHARIALGLEYKNLRNHPSMIYAHTTKGKGVSFMENNNLYHYKAPTQEEYERAKEELNGSTPMFNSCDEHSEDDCWKRRHKPTRGEVGGLNKNALKPPQNG